MFVAAYPIVSAIATEAAAVSTALATNAGRGAIVAAGGRAFTAAARSPMGRAVARRAGGVITRAMSHATVGAGFRTAVRGGVRQYGSKVAGIAAATAVTALVAQGASTHTTFTFPQIEDDFVPSVSRTRSNPYKGGSLAKRVKLTPYKFNAALFTKNYSKWPVDRRTRARKSRRRKT